MNSLVFIVLLDLPPQAVGVIESPALWHLSDWRHSETDF